MNVVQVTTATTGQLDELAQTQEPLDAQRALLDLLEDATSAHYAMADAIISLEGAHAPGASSIRTARDRLKQRCDAIRAFLGPRVHVLKTDPAPFKAVRAGTKKYEVRKFDRDFRIGDELKLVEFDRATSSYSGNKVRARVTAITKPGEYDLPSGIGVLGIEVVAVEGEGKV